MSAGFSRQIDRTLDDFRNNIKRTNEFAKQEVPRLGVSAIREFTPVDEGDLVKYLTKDPDVFEGSDSLTIGVGNVQELEPDSSAPKGTITKFLEWYFDTFGLEADPPGLPKGRMAYWGLTPEQRDLLRAQRQGDQFGGPKKTPKYFGAIDKGLVPGTGKNRNFAGAIAQALLARVSRAIQMRLGV